MSVEITWVEEFPKEIREAVAPILEEFLYLVPGWCRDIIMKWNPDSKSSLSTTVEYSYRFARIHVHAAWYDETPTERRRMFAHEILHITMEPLLEVHRWTINELDDGVYKERLKTQWKSSYEAVITDLSYIVVPTFVAIDSKYSPEPGQAIRPGQIIKQ